MSEYKQKKQMALSKSSISKIKSKQIQQEDALDLQSQAIFLMTELTSLLKKLEREI